MRSEERARMLLATYKKLFAFLKYSKFYYYLDTLLTAFDGKIRMCKRMCK